VELYFQFPNTPSWRGAELSTGTTLPSPYTHYYLNFVYGFRKFKKIILSQLLPIRPTKNKVVPVLNKAQRHEDVLGSGGIDSRIL
jgi:hypothetical protein